MEDGKKKRKRKKRGLKSRSEKVKLKGWPAELVAMATERVRVRERSQMRRGYGARCVSFQDRTGHTVLSYGRCGILPKLLRSTPEYSPLCLPLLSMSLGAFL